jgi:hypothetical protein
MELSKVMKPTLVRSVSGRLSSVFFTVSASVWSMPDETE